MRIKFTKTGANSAFGGFSAGDIFTCGDALGRHLVEDAKVAEYCEPPVKAVVADAPFWPATEAATPARRKVKK